MFTPRGGFPSGMEGVVRKTRFPPAEIRVQVSPNAWVDTQLALKTRGPGAPPPPWCRHSGSQSSRTTSPCFICDVTPVSKVLSVQQEHGLPGGSAGEESACDARDPGSIPGSGRSPWEGKTIHSSILAWRISMDRGAWQVTVHVVANCWIWLRD